MLHFCAHQNVNGTAQLLLAARERKDRIRKVIYSGSSTYYGGGQLPNREDVLPDCQTPYAVTKYFGEQYCELFTRLHGLPSIRLRYFMVYGPRQPDSGPYAVVNGVFMDNWKSGQPLTILGDGQQTRDFVHVSEVAEANIRAFESDITDATINVGTGHAISILDLANIFSDKLVFKPPRVPDIPHSLADTSRLKNLLGWVPSRNVVDYFKEEIREMVRDSPARYIPPGWLSAEAANATPTSSKKTDALKISVVVPTYNRAEVLRKTLDCLEKQDLEKTAYEVVVVDDGSPDATGATVAEIAPRMRCPVRYLRHENRGASFTANRGLRAAQAAIVLLIADDIQLRPDAVREHLRTHRENPGRGVCVLGRVDQSPELRQSTFIRNWDPFQFRDLKHVTKLPYYRFWICNMSAKREFLIEQNGFWETSGRAGPHDHSDVELGFRLQKNGLTILYNENAQGDHLHLETLDQAIARYYQRGLNWAPYLDRAPDPEINVAHHIFNSRTAIDHVKVLFGPNDLRGLDANPLAHLIFHAVRLVTFNAVTVRWCWRPLFDFAEKSPFVAALMNRQLYRVFLYYHFIKGVHDGRTIYGEGPGDVVHRHAA
jgi:UDP-glucose 4-epimerase